MGEEKNTKWKYVPDMGHHMLPQAEICCRDQDEKLVAAQISEEQAAQFLKHSETEQENAVWDNGWLQEKLDMLRASGNHFLLLLWGEHEEKCLLFLSDTKRVRPLEFLDYLMPDFGLIRGDVSCASVRVSSVILKLQMEAQGTETRCAVQLGQLHGGGAHPAAGGRQPSGMAAVFEPPAGRAPARRGQPRPQPPRDDRGRGKINLCFAK